MKLPVDKPTQADLDQFKIWAVDRGHELTSTHASLCTQFAWLSPQTAELWACWLDSRKELVKAYIKLKSSHAAQAQKLAILEDRGVKQRKQIAKLHKGEPDEGN